MPESSNFSVGSIDGLQRTSPVLAPPDMESHAFRPTSRWYLHFDRRISSARAIELATNPLAVEHHSFYPFIQRVLRTPRYRKDERKVGYKERQVMFAAHGDAAIYEYYGNELLTHAYEHQIAVLGIADAPVAYRRFPVPKCNVHFALAAFKFIPEHAPCVALCFDVEGFFDNLDHKLLCAAWGEVLGGGPLPGDHYAVFRSITRYSFVAESDLMKTFGFERRAPGRLLRWCTPPQFRSEVREAGLVSRNQLARGIPQGSPMSGVLSNIYMLPFDRVLYDWARAHQGFYQRYSDDIIVVVPPEFADAAEAEVLGLIEERKLALNGKKSERIDFHPGGKLSEPGSLQYLGLLFDGQRKLIRSQTLSRYYSRARRKIRHCVKAAATGESSQIPFRRTLMLRYSHRGKRNFIHYAHRAAEITGSRGIRRQVARHVGKISRWVDEMGGGDANA